MSLYRVKSIKLPLFVPSNGEKDQPTLKNVVRAVLVYCNQMPNMCEIKEVPDDYQSNRELIFEFDRDKYRFFDVISPISLFYGIKYGDEYVIKRLYESKFIKSLNVLGKCDDILRLMDIKVEFQTSFLEQMLNSDEGEDVDE